MDSRMELQWLCVNGSMDSVTEWIVNGNPLNSMDFQQLILKNTILWIFSESPPNLGRFHYEFTLTPAGGVGFAVGHGVGRVS